jgi:predicted ArsR family transcriptional regulator
MGRMKESYYGDMFADVTPYPHGPGVKSVHSLESARLIAPKVGPQQKLVLDSLRKDGPATADEVGARVGISLLNSRPRITELFRLGLVERTGEKRRNKVSNVRAAVWRAKEEGIR